MQGLPFEELDTVLRERANFKQSTLTFTNLEVVLTKTRNDLKRPTTSETQPSTNQTYLQQAKERSETTNNKQILRLFYNIEQSVLFSNTFLTQHLVAIIRALLHRELW